MGALARYIIAIEESPARDPKLTFRDVSELGESVIALIDCIYVGHHRQHVNDWLRVDARNGSAADVMQGQQVAAQQWSNLLCRLFEDCRPGRIGRDDDDTSDHMQADT